MLGNTLVTIQTGDAGKQVNHLYVTEGLDIAEEYYLSMVIGRRRHGHQGRRPFNG